MNTAPCSRRRCPLGPVLRRLSPTKLCCQPSLPGLPECRLPSHADLTTHRLTDRQGPFPAVAASWPRQDFFPCLVEPSPPRHRSDSARGSVFSLVRAGLSPLLPVWEDARAATRRRIPSKDALSLSDEGPSAKPGIRVRSSSDHHRGPAPEDFAPCALLLLQQTGGGLDGLPLSHLPIPAKPPARGDAALFPSVCSGHA